MRTMQSNQSDMIFSDLLESILSRDIPQNEDKVAVLLSGGMDSASVALSAQRLGKRIHAYSFYLDGSPTYDSLKAKDISEHFGFEYTSIDVSTDNLKSDFIRLATDYACRKKTHFECAFPFLQINSRIQERVVLSGLAADGHYGLSKRAMIHFKHPKEKFDQFRTDYFSNPNPAGVSQLRQLCDEQQQLLLVPYLDEQIFDYFIQFDWNEINKPKQKSLIRNCYPELADLNLKSHLNYQLVAGVNIAFERLLDDPNINFKNRVRVMDICRDWHKLISADV